MTVAEPVVLGDAVRELAASGAFWLPDPPPRCCEDGTCERCKAFLEELTAVMNRPLPPDGLRGCTHG